ncbi:transglutaminase N-terminal domain-containing protein, partial [Aphanothece microscopica]|uniref:transglutaminase N-terminal domain-containing protein n=1 Tax=Aphanothece microscopica TaxID=1049561 RepID=UPI0039848A15
MLLTVDHVTRYSYDRPVRGVVQSHRLTPSACDGQRVRDWQVTVTDGQPGGAFRDGAGDWVQGWSVRGPVAGIEVRVQGTVETADLAGVLRGHRESVPPMVYLTPTPPTRADGG